jgi:hypothetical protein
MTESRKKSRELLNKAMNTRDEILKALKGLQLVQTQEGGRVHKLFKKLQEESADWMEHNGLSDYFKKEKRK